MEFQPIIDFIRQNQPGREVIALHEPTFCGNEERYLSDVIRSTFVSTVGEYIGRFEKSVTDYTGHLAAVALVNGTQALFLALKLSGVGEGDEVIMPSLTFVATANATTYTGASPVFLDVERELPALSTTAVRSFLDNKCERRGETTINKTTGRRVRAVVPVHIFGHPAPLAELAELCRKYNLALVEDATEALGSRIDSRHVGHDGEMAVLSFNGNKVVTTGGGGMLLTNDLKLAERARHLATTAKVSHPSEYIHDEIGYNFRMPNLNAALGLAQMERLPELVTAQRELADRYRDLFAGLDGVRFLSEPSGAASNYWLNTAIFEKPGERDDFIAAALAEQIQVRAIWRPMHRLEIYKNCYCAELTNTEYIYARGVNLPSTPQLEK